MIKSLKKNQIVIFAVALMLITAGYLNYTMNTEQTAEVWSEINNEQISGIGDAKLVSSNNVLDENGVTSSIVQNNSGVNEIEDSEDGFQENSTVEETSAKTNEDIDKYFTESRLEREKMYSEMLETYQTMIAGTNVSSEQRYNAQLEISNITSQKNAIMIAENLIKNKGFEDVVIFVNNGSVSVIVKAEILDEADIAQIQNIVQRELGVEVQNIHISNK